MSSVWAQVLLHSFLIFTEGVVRVLAGKEANFLVEQGQSLRFPTIEYREKRPSCEKGIEQLTFEQVRLMNDDGIWRLL